jgi:hypothetical protein
MCSEEALAKDRFRQRASTKRRNIRRDGTGRDEVVNRSISRLRLINIAFTMLTYMMHVSITSMNGSHTIFLLPMCVQRDRHRLISLANNQ